MVTCNKKKRVIDNSSRVQWTRTINIIIAINSSLSTYRVHSFQSAVTPELRNSNPINIVVVVVKHVLLRLVLQRFMIFLRLVVIVTRTWIFLLPKDDQLNCITNARNLSPLEVLLTSLHTIVIFYFELFSRRLPRKKLSISTSLTVHHSRNYFCFTFAWVRKWCLIVLRKRQLPNWISWGCMRSSIASHFTQLRHYQRDSSSTQQQQRQVPTYLNDQRRQDSRR